METEVILGIDLGTTNSVVSVLSGREPRVLEENGAKILPSVVGLDAQGKLLVGEPARNQWVLAPDRTVRSIKRKMGTAETTRLGEREYTPQEISAIILRTLKDRATRVLGHEVTKAVITVPAFFNEQQREATREAGLLAGLDVVRIINEPTAAALTYHPQQTDRERLLVYDLGGGTFDVSIVQIEKGVVEVLASHGDTKLGGDDFDQLLLDYVCDKFREEHDVDLRESLVSKSRVLRAVEAAKIRLSSQPYTTLEEEFIAERAGLPLHLVMEISRLDYENLIEPLLNKTLVCVDEALADAKLLADKIDRVVLVGGSSRTPLVHRLLTEQLGQPIHAEIDPDLCVAMGAAVQGGLISGADVGPVLVDITPHTLGVQCRGDLHGFESNFLCEPLIRRNSALPACAAQVFTTCYDGQDAVRVCVFQGESDDVRHNDLVGEFVLEGLADVEAGNAIVVQFQLDLNGLLKVAAIEKATGLSQQLTIDNAFSQFSADGRADAQENLDAVFGSAAAATHAAPAGQPGDAPAVESRSPELTQAVGAANYLLSNVELLLAERPEVNDDELRRLMMRLRAALARPELDELRRATALLDDLVYYLQGV